MRRIVILGALGAFLAGCAAQQRLEQPPVFDPSAVPAAAMQENAEIQACTGLSLTTVSQAMGCIISADSHFMVAIKLHDWSIFEAYKNRLTVLAQQSDAKQITPQQLGDGYKSARADLANGLDQLAAIDGQQRAYAAQADADQRARFAGALAAFGQSMQQQALIQQANRPVVCNTSRMGNFSTTTCN